MYPRVNSVVVPVTLEIYNAPASLTSANPSSVQAGTGPITLTLAGSNFLQGAIAQLGQIVVSTTFVSSTQLTAIVPSSALLNGGTYNLVVFNPSPGGGSSAGIPFSVVDSSKRRRGQVTSQ